MSDMLPNEGDHSASDGVGNEKAPVSGAAGLTAAEKALAAHLHKLAEGDRLEALRGFHLAHEVLERSVLNAQLSRLVEQRRIDRLETLLALAHQQRPQGFAYGDPLARELAKLRELMPPNSGQMIWIYP